MFYKFRHSFTHQELQHLVIASILVILVFLSMVFNPFVQVSLQITLFIYLLYALGGLMIFLSHEFGHKYLARRYGFFAEFRLIQEGAILTAISIFLPFLKIILPGTVAVSNWNSDLEQVGRIALIGPLINLITTGLLLFVSGLLYNYPLLDGTLTYGKFFFFLSLLAINIAVFNLIPLGPLDGLKVLTWDREVYYVTLGITFIAWLILNSFLINI